MHGNHWTGELVLEHLVEAFASLPGAPIYSPGPGVLLQATYLSQPVRGGALIVATGHYLGFQSAIRRRLLAYCRAKAAGTTVAELCLAEGWARASLYRHVKGAADLVAEGLNRDRTPPKEVGGNT